LSLESWQRDYTSLAAAAALTGFDKQCVCVSVKTFYRLKGSRPITRPQLMQESLEQCADTVTQKLISYSTQAEHYLNDCVNGE